MLHFFHQGIAEVSRKKR